MRSPLNLLPDSLCETVVTVSTNSDSHENFDEQAKDNNRWEKNLWPSAAGHFEDILLDDNVGIEFHGLLTIWRICLACAGALDILAYLLPLVVQSGAKASSLKYRYRYIDPEYSHYNVVIRTATLLDDHNVAISCLFLSLWFIDAFVAAHARRAKFLMEEEKTRYLSSTDDFSDSPAKKRWENARLVYYQSIILQLLLLPVGYYCLLFNTVDQVVRGRMDFNDDILFNKSDLDSNTEIDSKIFSNNSKVSVFYACVHLLYQKVSGTTTRTIQSNLREFLKRIRPAAFKGLLGRAIRNPRQLRRDIQRIQTTVRWIKYLSPLIGTLNKLKFNLDDLRVKRRQRSVAMKQKRIRQLLWEQKSIHLRKQDAARLIQGTFRCYKNRMATQALILFQLDRRRLATIRIQRVLRKSLARARARIRKKKLELRQLSQKRHFRGDSLNQEEKRHFYQLQDELAHHARSLINRRLLLRPNTRFSVVWKLVFVCCILFEISQLLAKPWLDNYRSQRQGKSMTMANFVAISFTPTRASLRPECSPHERHWWEVGHIHNTPPTDILPWYCRYPGSLVQETYSDLVSLLLVPAPVADWPDCRDEKPRLWTRKVSEPKRWYCHEPYKSTHMYYRKVFDFFLEEFLLVVSTICFLDDFVVFFTGEIDDMTGDIRPKPFVARWIAPGLLLQLLINPRLIALANFLASFKGTVVTVGLVRVLRWSVATIFPIVYLLWTSCIQYLWIPLVYRENQRKTVMHGLL